MSKPQRDENGRIPRITKSMVARLVENDGSSYPIGEFSLTEPEPGPTLQQFADAAFKSSRQSLMKLMPHRYRIVLTDGEGAENGFGLDRWVKLVDREKEHAMRLRGEGPKQRLRRTEK